jgi:hypothetical protein
MLRQICCVQEASWSRRSDKEVQTLVVVTEGDRNAFGVARAQAVQKDKVREKMLSTTRCACRA